jgi:hypothetical protein
MVLRSYARCTRWIDVLEDRSTLERWGRRMLLVGAASAPDLVETAKVHDPADSKGREKLDGLAGRLIDLAGAHEKRDAGTRIHGLTELVDRREPIPEGYSMTDLLDAAAYMLATAELRMRSIERRIVVDDLRVTGTPDRVSSHPGLTPDGRPAGDVITDLKTGRIDCGALKIAMQMAMYAHGQYYYPATGRREPFEVNQRWGLVVSLPAGTGTAELLWVDLELGWEAVQLVVKVRGIRSRGAKALHSCESVSFATTNGMAPD